MDKQVNGGLLVFSAVPITNLREKAQRCVKDCNLIVSVHLGPSKVDNPRSALLVTHRESDDNAYVRKK